jgi:hypothetical protein
MKNSPRPLLLHQTLQLALFIGAFCWHLPTPDLSEGLSVKCDSLLRRTSLHCSRVQWWRALHYSSQRLALHMVILGLCAAAQPLKHISWTVFLLELLPEAVWNSVVSVATQNRWFSRTTRFSTRWSRRRFHFTITALDRGSSSREEIGQNYLLERWRLYEALHWRILSSSVRPFCCRCLSMEILYANFIHLSATGMCEIAESTDWKGVHILLYI